MLIAVLASLAWVWVAQTLVRVTLGVGLLPARKRSKLPSLSVVVAARDEQDTIVPALRSLLLLAVPDLEIILVNDRSSDATGDLMESVAAGDKRVRVVHIEHLEAGWLGKNQALHRGAAQATGDWLLFSDADVHFQPDSLARALTLAEEDKLDHLVVGPHIECGTFWEKIFVGFFGAAFCSRYRPDLACKPGPYFMGVGAFNLVRRQLYRELGGHSTLKMQVLDDMELGRLLKARGYRQRFVGGGRSVTVRWCVGWNGLLQGLEKNAYAGLNYSPLMALGSCAIMVWASLSPLWLCLHGFWAWGLLGLLAMEVCALSTSAVGNPPWVGFFYPLAGLVLVYIILRAACLCHWRGGVRWRQTFYPLKELRQAAPV